MTGDGNLAKSHAKPGSIRNVGVSVPVTGRVGLSSTGLMLTVRTFSSQQAFCPSCGAAPVSPAGRGDDVLLRGHLDPAVLGSVGFAGVPNQGDRGFCGC